MHVEKAENLRLGKTERVQYGAGLERRVSGQINDELHAHGPIARVMAFRRAEALVQLLADVPDRAVADDRERGVNVHAGRETVAWRAFLVHALVEQANADHLRSAQHRLGSVRGFSGSR